MAGKTSLVERYLHNIFTGDVPYQSVSKIIRFDSVWGGGVDMKVVLFGQGIWW